MVSIITTGLAIFGILIIIGIVAAAIESQKIAL